MSALQSLYLLLAILGTLLPYSRFLPFLRTHGLDIPLALNQLFQQDIPAFFGWDVLVSSVVLWLFVLTEGRRQGMKHLWIYIGCNLLVGVSLALPLFLFMRERTIATQPPLTPTAPAAARS